MYAHLNGVDLYFDVVGAGYRPTPDGPVDKPVMFVHHGGPGCDHTLFRPFLDDLAEVAQLIFVDHRGTGRSGRADTATYTIEQMADDVEALRHYLGVDKPIFAGHSFGGMVAQIYAARYPRTLSKLVLLNTAPSFGFWAEAQGIAEKMATDAQKTVVDVLFNGELNSQREFEDWWATCLPLYFKQPNETILDSMGKAMKGDVVVANYMMANEIPKYDARPGLPDITIPTLVTSGAWDWVTPPTQSEQIIAGIPHAEYVSFQNSGHMPFIEEHDAFIKAMTDFIAR